MFIAKIRRFIKKHHHFHSNDHKLECIPKLLGKCGDPKLCFKIHHWLIPIYSSILFMNTPIVHHFSIFDA
jgi:hypothetical protein